MTLAEKLKNNGAGNPDFERHELMLVLESKIRKYGSASFIIGRHVGTDLNGILSTIGDCNPYNREFLYKWLKEEGFRFSSSFNVYGVERITVTV